MDNIEKMLMEMSREIIDSCDKALSDNESRMDNKDRNVNMKRVNYKSINKIMILLLTLLIGLYFSYDS